MSYDKYRVSINIFDVIAKTRQYAVQLALKQLENLAGSNDGSEVLANAQPQAALVARDVQADAPEYPVTTLY